MPLLHFSLSLLLAPLLLGIINRTKAVFAGRKGPPLGQLYYDLAKLLRKGAVYSQTTTWVFRAGPLVGLAAVIAALALLPLAGRSAVLAFGGDIVVFAYLLGLARFFTVLAALDTGSSFEGMGASREVQFAALAEPALFLGLMALVRQTSQLSLTAIYEHLPLGLEHQIGLALVAAAWIIVLLAENSRLPVDDPSTHLELTMIHEVMVLDHGGPDLAFILYAAALKLWLLGALLVNLMLSFFQGSSWIGGPLFLLGMGALAVLIGVIESSMARLRLNQVPHLLVGAGALAALAAVFVLR